MSGGNAPKREEAHGSIVRATGKTKKSALALRRVASRIAAIRRRAYGLRVLDKRKAGEGEHRECTAKNILFCFPVPCRKFFTDRKVYRRCIG